MNEIPFMILALRSESQASLHFLTTFLLYHEQNTVHDLGTPIGNRKQSLHFLTTFLLYSKIAFFVHYKRMLNYIFYLSVPKKNKAMVPGPEWDPITGPIGLITKSFTFILSLISCAKYSASSTASP